MMNNLFKEVYDCETGELQQFPLTDAEIATWKAEAEKNRLAEQEAKAQNEAKRLVLEKLGITEEEAKLLLGGI